MFKAKALVVAALFFLLISSAASGAARSGRQDLKDLERLLQFIRDLYPQMEPHARVRMWGGYLQEDSRPFALDLTIFVEARPGIAPERTLYGGAARFDQGGRLEFYAGKWRVSEERFERLKEMLQAKSGNQHLRATLKVLGAPYAESAPTTSNCPSLRIALGAVGSVASQRPPELEHGIPAEETQNLQRADVAWRIEVAVRRGRVLQRLRITIDPWGDLIGVTQEGAMPGQ